MNFMQELKLIAQQIIELSSKLGERTHTWNQEEFAPAGGYTDRAGFIVFDEIELFADVYAPKGETIGLLRLRLAWVHQNKLGQDLFTIITLDFNSDLEKTKAIIGNSDNLTQQTLITLLNNQTTTAKLIQVSLDSGKDIEGNSVGTRHEYTADELQKISETSQNEFLSTIQQAYNQIFSKT